MVTANATISIWIHCIIEMGTLSSYKGGRILMTDESSDDELADVAKHPIVAYTA